MGITRGKLMVGWEKGRMGVFDSWGRVGEGALHRGWSWREEGDLQLSTEGGASNRYCRGELVSQRGRLTVGVEARGA